MPSLKVALFSLIFFAAVVHRSLTLDCYQCDDTPPFDTTDCSKGNVTTWGKILACDDKVFKCVVVKGSDGKPLIRGCMTETHCKAYSRCKSCNDKNFCNTGSSSSSLVPFYVITVVAAAIARYH